MKALCSIYTALLLLFNGALVKRKLSGGTQNIRDKRLAGGRFWRLREAWQKKAIWSIYKTRRLCSEPLLLGF